MYTANQIIAIKTELDYAQRRFDAAETTGFYPEWEQHPDLFPLHVKLHTELQTAQRTYQKLLGEVKTVDQARSYLPVVVQAEKVSGTAYKGTVRERIIHLPVVSKHIGDVVVQLLAEINLAKRHLK